MGLDNLAIKQDVLPSATTPESYQYLSDGLGAYLTTYNIDSSNSDCQAALVHTWNFLGSVPARIVLLFIDATVPGRS